MKPNHDVKPDKQQQKLQSATPYEHRYKTF